MTKPTVPEPSPNAAGNPTPLPSNLTEAARAAVDAYNLYLKSEDDLELLMAFAGSMGHLEYHVGKAEQGK